MTEEIIEFELGDVDLLSGQTLKSAILVAKSWGQLSAARDNVIVLPTYYTGTHDGYAPLVGPGNVFDTNDYFVISPNLFGNGLSTSPSNSVDSVSGPYFPTVDIYDNVICHADMEPLYYIFYREKKYPMILKLLLTNYYGF